MGGLVGENYGGSAADAVIRRCRSRSVVAGGSGAGGLVGYNYGGSVEHCWSEGVVRGDDAVGGLSGSSRGTSFACSSTGMVEGNDRVGGLIGTSKSETVIQCWSDCDVNGVSNVGGLIGYIDGCTVNDCYARGGVQGMTVAGGFVGRLLEGNVSKAYCVGSVTGEDMVGGFVGSTSYVVPLSFWDIENSGCDVANGSQVAQSIHGRTTAEMQSSVLYTNALWDFTEETENGTSDIWTICEGTNYPRLTSQIPLGDIICPDGVDWIDYLALAAYWGELGCAAGNDCGKVDIDLSGVVDMGDFAVLAQHWLERK